MISIKTFIYLMTNIFRRNWTTNYYLAQKNATVAKAETKDRLKEN